MFKKPVLISSLLLIIYIIFRLFYRDKTEITFNSINVAILAIMVIVWSILFFYEQLTKPADGNQLFLYSSPSFWIVTAYFIYFAGTFFLFIYSQGKNIKSDTEFENQYNLIHGVFVLIKNILLSMAMFSSGGNIDKHPAKYRSNTY
jgi:ABC-type dipeptide/oligopeptide/nickel transport system permease component